MSEQSQALRDIRNFTEFLEKCLKRKVLEYTLQPLTKPGENYGSIMQWVKVKVAGVNSPSEVYLESNIRHYILLFYR